MNIWGDSFSPSPSGLVAALYCTRPDAQPSLLVMMIVEYHISCSVPFHFDYGSFELRGIRFHLNCRDIDISLLLQTIIAQLFSLPPSSPCFWYAILDGYDCSAVKFFRRRRRSSKTTLFPLKVCQLPITIYWSYLGCDDDLAIPLQIQS